MEAAPSGVSSPTPHAMQDGGGRVEQHGLRFADRGCVDLVVEVVSSDVAAWLKGGRVAGLDESKTPHICVCTQLVGDPKNELLQGERRGLGSRGGAERVAEPVGDYCSLIITGVGEAHQQPGNRRDDRRPGFPEDTHAVVQEAVTESWLRAGHPVVDHIESQPRTYRHHPTEPMRGVIVDLLDKTGHTFVLVSLRSGEQPPCRERPGVAPERARRGNAEPDKHVVERAGAQVHAGHEFLQRSDVEAVPLVAAGRNQDGPLVAASKI